MAGRLLWTTSPIVMSFPDLLTVEPLYHGSADPLPETVRCGDETRWWSPMDHDTFLNPPWDEEIGADNGELASELRTAYANIVYEAFLSSEDVCLRAMAEEYGLSGLGSKVGILFVTPDRDYVERYGEAYEIDLDADGVLDVLADENASRTSYFLVLKAGIPFPLKASYQTSPAAPGM